MFSLETTHYADKNICARIQQFYNVIKSQQENIDAEITAETIQLECCLDELALQYEKIFNDIVYKE